MSKRFKRFLAVAAILFFTEGICFARAVVTMPILNATNSTSIAVNGTATVYTQEFPIESAQYFEASYLANSTNGSVNVTIQLEQGSVVPATEGAANGNFTVPVNQPDIVTGLTTEDTWYHAAFSPVPLTYGRFKITGLGSNNADTILKIKVNEQVD